MKHLFKKMFIKGAGGGKKPPKPKPAVLKPPPEMEYSMIQSFSVAEVIDLLSDGPIEGLVNQNGNPVSDSTLLQGIYLDNTPIAESKNTQFSSIIGSYDISNIVNPFGNAFYDQGKEIKVSFRSGRPAYSRAIEYLYKRVYRPGPRSSVVNAYYNYNGLTRSLYRPTIVQSDFGWYPINLGGGHFFCNSEDTSATRIHIHCAQEKYTLGHWNSSYWWANLLPRLQSHINENLGDPNVSEWEKDLYKKKSTRLSYLSSSRNYGTAAVVISFGLKTGVQGLMNTEPIIIEELTNKSPYIDQSNIPREISFQLKGVAQSFNDLCDFLLFPEVDESEGIQRARFTGKVYGCVVITLPLSYSYVNAGGSLGDDLEYIWQLPLSIISFTNDNIKLEAIDATEVYLAGFSPPKYNFSNISAEIKHGDELQSPLSIIPSTKIDYEKKSLLIGPFRLPSYSSNSSASVQRITNDWQTAGKAYSNPTLNLRDLSSESSQDYRGSLEYARWNLVSSLDEEAKPITHIIENPNVSSFSFSLGVENLSDSLEKTVGALEVGTKTPAIVQFKVEWGKITNGVYSVYSSKTYALLAQIEGSTIIDFGNSSSAHRDLNNAIRDPSSFADIDFTSPYELPPLLPNESPSSCKRFVRLTKLSAETNSVLINKEIYLEKITENVPHKFSYPFSSLVAMRIDARSFTSIPERTYDCRLKKVKIPTNYFPLSDEGKDLRYLDHEQALLYNKTNKIYKGDWDGSFREGWTDNPAWIIYDLLTSSRYGLGQYIDESQINIWQLYKIARFCDAVDDEGFFEGVSDGNGGLEPRFSCNILFKDSVKIFDAINIVSNLFRGMTFFSNSEINFLDDRPRLPIALFTNSNVKDGLFNYSNYRRDEQFNTIEVSFLDRFDNYQSKIEYVEDAEDVRKRGPLKKMIAAEGVTSRAMARRAGQHFLYQSLKENQGVEFIAGTEALLCVPGDLIIVEDDLKTRSTNYGRILAVDYANKYITIEELYLPESFSGRITTFSPTGMSTNEELSELALKNRSRTDSFYITGSNNLISTFVTGLYRFSGYRSGFSADHPLSLPVEFPLYTGTSNGSSINRFCWYSTDITGFVFAYNKLGVDNLSSPYNKFNLNTGAFNVLDAVSLVSGVLSEVNSGYSHLQAYPHRGELHQAHQYFSGAENYYQGLLEEEINAFNVPQISTFNITGWDNDTSNNTCVLRIDKEDWNANMLNVVKDGYPYRIARQNALDSIYKIISIRESNQNEYTVIASKYDTGKFNIIENFSAAEWLPETYYSGPTIISNIDISQFDSPTIVEFTTGSVSSTGFSLTGKWTRPGQNGNYPTGYLVTLSNVLSNISIQEVITTTGISFEELSVMGKWTLSVKALAQMKVNDSIASKAHTFVAYSDISPLSKAVISNISIK